MTSPSDNTDSRYWFGRMDGKLDQIGEKMSHLAETVGRHDERIGNIEDRQDRQEELRAADQVRAESARADAEQVAKSGRWGMKSAVVGALSGAFTGGVFSLIQAFTSHK